MKTYRVEYPGHSAYVEANSPEEAFYKVSRENLRELQEANKHTAHLYRAVESVTIKSALNAVAGGFCVVAVAILVVIAAAIGLTIK